MLTNIFQNGYPSKLPCPHTDATESIVTGSCETTAPQTTWLSGFIQQNTRNRRYWLFWGLFGTVFPRIRGTRCNIIQPCQRLSAVNNFKTAFPLIAQTEKFPETAFTQVVI